MKADNTITDIHTDNQLSKEEEQKALDWFDTEEGREYVSQKMSEDFGKMIGEEAAQGVDHPVQSERMKRRFLEHLGNDIKKKKSIKWLQIAAVLFPFLVLSGALTFFANYAGVFSKTEYAELRVPCGEQMQVVLQDGSVVLLNSDSYLRYPKSFDLFSREIQLSGEGFFSVAKDRSRPFILNLNGVAVKVTGTEFNVKAYPDEEWVFVTLTKGNVYLQDQFDKKYSLAEGETAEYNRKSAACLILATKDEAAVTAWRSKSLNFYRTPLKDIIKVLERRYNVRFMVADSTLLENRFTISTGKIQVEDIVKDLEKVSRIRFTPISTDNFSITAVP